MHFAPVHHNVNPNSGPLLTRPKPLKVSRISSTLVSGGMLPTYTLRASARVHVRGGQDFRSNVGASAPLCRVHLERVWAGEGVAWGAKHESGSLPAGHSRNPCSS